MNVSAAPAPDERLEEVANGVFFTLPDALPTGRHKLPREEILAAQRERLLVATTELLAARGYRGFGIADIARRARVSMGAFYDCFTSKDVCVYAGYDRFIDVLLQRMVAVDVPADNRPGLARALIAAYLETLQQDLVVARAYQVEIDALGADARERRRASLTLFADYIRQRTADQEPLPETAYLGAVYAARQLASDALDREPSPDLTALGADLHLWMADLFRHR